MKEKTETWNKVLVVTLRILVGAVFLFSGFVKAIDPWGSFYKFSEYLSAVSLPGLEWFALFAAFAVAALEMVLGMCVLLGAFRRGSVVLLLAMMLVMLPLTFYLAVTDLVPDCGCFGDAVHLSNWATFGKNLVITAALVWLLIYNKCVPCVMGPAVHWIIAFFTLMSALAIAYVGYFKQPLIDFRPYKVGVSLIGNSNHVSDSDFVFIYEKDGEEREFAIDEVPDDADGWTYVRRKNVNQTNVVAQEGVRPIAVMDENGDDVTSEVFSSDAPNVLLLLFPDVKNVSISYTYVVNQLADMAKKEGSPAYGITSGTDEEIALWNDISMAAYPMLTADDSEIKMMARGNPAVVYIRDGRILWKRALGSIAPESVDSLRSDKLEDIDTDFDSNRILKWVFSSLIVALVVLFVINRTHRMVWFIGGKFRKKNGNPESGEDAESQAENSTSEATEETVS